jgi:hypothetical protein
VLVQAETQQLSIYEEVKGPHGVCTGGAEGTSAAEQEAGVGGAAAERQ